MDILELLGKLGYALDTPGAYTRGLLAGRPGERVDGREMLESLGLLGSNQEGLDFGDVLGFGAEVLLDPLNLIPAGMLGRVAGRGAKALRHNKNSKALRAAGFMPEEIAGLTQAATKQYPYSETNARVLAEAMAVPPEDITREAYESLLSTSGASGMDNPFVDRGDILNMLAKSDDYVTAPKTMYHGSPHAFGQFDPSKQGPNLFSYGDEVAAYLTDKPHVASAYASKKVPDLVTPPSRNVRMHYVDSRNPFRMDEVLDQEEAARLISDAGFTAGDVFWDEFDRAGSILPPDEFDSMMASTTDPSNLATLVALRANVPASKRSQVYRIASKIKDMQRKGKDRWTDYYQDGSAEAIGLSDVMDADYTRRGEALYKAVSKLPGKPWDTKTGVDVWRMLGGVHHGAGATLANQRLKNAGYDAIQHIGGRRRGGLGDHDVYIPFSTDQIYKPYIAPAMDPYRTTQDAELYGALGLGAAHNTMRGVGRD